MQFLDRSGPSTGAVALVQRTVHFPGNILVLGSMGDTQSHGPGKPGSLWDGPSGRA